MTLQYIPEGFELVEMRDSIGEYSNRIRGAYQNEKSKEYINFDVGIYSEEYAEGILENLSGWEKIKNASGEEIYFSDGVYETVIIRNNFIYDIAGNVSLEEFQKVIEYMQ